MTGSSFASGLPPFVTLVQLDATQGLVEPLWPEEQAILHPRAVASRRLDFQIGRAAAHRAVRLLGEDSAPILRGDHGQPVWPDGIVGSITHVAGRAICVVARRDMCGGLGIDLEHRGRQFPELAQHVATEEEEAWLQALPELRRLPATLELFSAKESIYKAFFPRAGRFFDFSAVVVTPVSRSGYEGRFVEPIDEQYPSSRSFAIECEWKGDFVLTSVVLPP